MRDEIQAVVRQFQARELPADEEYFQRHRAEVEGLVHALGQQTGHSVSWEPPVELFNFHHLQLPLDPALRLVPLHGKPNNLLRRMLRQGRPTSFLHVLVSPFSQWVYTYWQRFTRVCGSFQEIISVEDGNQNSDEHRLMRLVQQVIETHGWHWLPPAEGAEPVPGADPVWPALEGPTLVRDLLFPGCAALID